MTYNIHAGRGWRRSPRHWASPRRVADIAAVIASYAPDLCLLQEVDVEQPRELADATGMTVRAIASITGGDRRDYGIATLGKLPVLESRELVMRDRFALLTRHAFEGGELAVINVHLSMTRRLRMAQVVALRDALPPGPCILAGDFNTIARRLAPGFRPAARIVPSWPAPLPLWPVDHILARGFEVVEARVWTGANARWTSDHLPVVAELRATV